MNKAQRTQLDQIVNTLSSFADAEYVKTVGVEDTIAALQSAADEIDEIAQEERDKYDNLPENFQQGERGQDMEAAAEALESAAQMLREISADVKNLPEDWAEKVAGEVSAAIDEAQSF